MNIAIVTSVFTIGNITYSPGDEIDDPVTVALIQGNPAFLQKAAIVSGTPGTISAPAGTTSPTTIPSPAVIIEAIAGVNAVDYMTPVATDAVIANRIAPLATQGSLGLETSRATAAEQILSTALAAEIVRAQTAEQNNAAGYATNAAGVLANATAIQVEVVRAKGAEQANASAIATTNGALSTEVARAKAAEATLVPQTTTISPGAGLTGGGALSTNLALSIAAKGVTPSMLAPAPAGTILSNPSGSAASPTPNTPSAILDAAFGSTQGAVLIRGGTAWNSLGIGSQGQVLTVSAAGVPSWVTVAGTGTVTQVSTGTGLTGGPITGSGTIALLNLPVYADTAQGLTTAQQAQARSNAGAAASGANTDITSLNGPAIGNATANTPSPSDSSTRVATTAMVQGAAQAAVAPVQASVTAVATAASFNFVAGIIF